MKTAILRAAAGAAALAAGLAGAQTYSTYPSSTYPSYGYGNTSGIVRCESINSRSNFCRVDTRGGVQLYRQLSRENCIRGRNWEVRSDGILVDDGCRAEFALGTAYAGTRTVIGTDRYGRPIYGSTGTYGGGYATDRYGRPIHDSRYGYGSNGGYAYDRYGNRIYVGSGGVYDDGYTYDRYGNHVYVGSSGAYGSGGYYATDRYGNRVWVENRSAYGSGGYYTTDRYGNRVWVESSGYGRVYDDDYSTADQVYDRNNAMGPPVYSGTPQVEVISGGTTTSSSTYSTGVIHCRAAVSGKTYCGDRNQKYTIHQESPVGCVLERTYGRDSGGYWVSSGCDLRLEPSNY